MAEFRGRDGLAAAEDAFEPVAVLFLAFVEMNFVGADDGLDDLGVAGGEGGGVV